MLLSFWIALWIGTKVPMITKIEVPKLSLLRIFFAKPDPSIHRGFLKPVHRGFLEPVHRELFGTRPCTPPQQAPPVPIFEGPHPSEHVFALETPKTCFNHTHNPNRGLRLHGGKSPIHHEEPAKGVSKRALSDAHWAPSQKCPNLPQAPSTVPQSNQI